MLQLSEYWRENSRKPSREECRKYYRNHPASTGEEDIGDICRLNAVYDYVDQWFKPEKVGTGRINADIEEQNIDRNQQLLLNTINQEVSQIFLSLNSFARARMRVITPATRPK